MIHSDKRNTVTPLPLTNQKTTNTLKLRPVFSHGHHLNCLPPCFKKYLVLLPQHYFSFYFLSLKKGLRLGGRLRPSGPPTLPAAAVTHSFPAQDRRAPPARSPRLITALVSAGARLCSYRAALTPPRDPRCTSFWRAGPEMQGGERLAYLGEGQG